MPLIILYSFILLFFFIALETHRCFTYLFVDYLASPTRM